MNKIIDIFAKHNYGAEHIYVKDSETARIIQDLTNQKTINQKHIKALQELGFNFKVVPNLNILK